MGNVLARSLPPLPPSPAPPCLPCVEGQQRAAPHSSSFPPTTAPLQTLHMDVWGSARVRGQGRERYFLLVVDDYSCYTTVFPLRSKGEVPDVLIPWIRAVRLQLRERFDTDLPVLRLHSDRGGEFASDLLRDFCLGEGITQSFTLPASPQQNGVAECRIGLVMEVARTSMIHAAAPHFLWPFAVRYAAHQLNLWPRVSLPETSPTLRWTGKVGDASMFRVWGSRAFVRDTTRFPFTASSPTALPLSPPPPLFLAPGPPPVDPLPPQGPAPSGVSQVDHVEPVEVAVESGAAGGGAARGAASGGAEHEGAEPGVAESEGAEPRGAKPERAEPGDAEPRAFGVALLERGGLPLEALELETLELHVLEELEMLVPEVLVLELLELLEPLVLQALELETLVLEALELEVPEVLELLVLEVLEVLELLELELLQVLELEVLEGPELLELVELQALEQETLELEVLTLGVLVLSMLSQPQLQPASPLPAPSPYTEQTGGLTERREPASRPASPVRAVRTGRRVPRQRPPLVHGTHHMALRPSSVPQRVPLPSPPASSLADGPDPESDLLRAASPTITRLLATVVTDPSFESTAASALVAELVDIVAACRLDYAASLVAESESVCPPSVGGECALDTDTRMHKTSQTPRSYAEAITGPYSSQW
ncbi:unnamed protein product [Closterium sp. Naga37s-1]|nr:unnamed protein product [Closterium sp. Naga37s-1]